MTGVIFGILKLLLILVLVLLGLALLLLLLLLFAPISYRARGSADETVMDGRGRISWLFGTVSADIEYRHGVAKIGSIRLFGVKLYSIEGISEVQDEGQDKPHA